MNRSAIIASAAVLMALPLVAQQRESFAKSQALAEVQRVTSQIDILQENQQDLADRVAGVERSRAEIESLKADISALRAENAALRREMSEMRNTIIRELTGEIKKLKPAAAPAPVATYSGPMKEHVVEKGDTLSLIAEAFGTNVRQIREINGLKNDNLRIGQKIKVPAK